MRRRLEQAGVLLWQSLNLLPSVLIGSAIASPAFAATDIALDDLRMPILLGALALLVVALALRLRIRRGSSARKVRSNEDQFGEGIGRYRLKLGRGDAD
jgi:hypothetical protein